MQVPGIPTPKAGEGGGGQQEGSAWTLPLGFPTEAISSNHYNLPVLGQTCASATLSPFPNTHHVNPSVASLSSGPRGGPSSPLIPLFKDPETPLPFTSERLLLYHLPVWPLCTHHMPGTYYNLI